MKKIEYSQIVRRKLRVLKRRLTDEFGAETAAKSLKMITEAVRGLETFPEKGVSVSGLYNINIDYRYIYVRHNYLFYRIQGEKIIVVEMFDEREDFMYKLFDIRQASSDDNDYGDE